MIAGYHWFTDWGRDTMISLEGLTLDHRPARRGRLHPAHLRPLRPRRPDPQHVSRRPDRGPLPHRRRHALVLPRARPLRRGHRRSRDPARACCPKLVEIVEHHIEGTRFGIGVDPRDGLLRQGQEGYQLTWMDAKVGDWVVTPRRGKAVEINALWYNALRLLEGWVREAAATDAARPLRRARRSGPASRSTSGSGTTKAAIFTTWSTARTATTRPAGPTRSSRSRCEHPVLDRDALGAGAERGARAAADAGRPAFARPGPSRLQAAIFRRPARPRCGLPPGHGLGLADRPVHRCLAEGPSRRPRRRPPVPRRLRRPSRARPASARSARSSTPSRRSRRAAASPRPGASPRCSGAGSRRPIRTIETRCPDLSPGRGRGIDFPAGGPSQYAWTAGIIDAMIRCSRDAEDTHP